MKCKKCKREVPENSIFCNWCGSRQIKQKDEVKVPEPVQLPSGKWRVQLRREGQSVVEETPEKAKAKARAIRAGFQKAQSAGPKMTVGRMIDTFIDNNEVVLSPSTVKAYKSYRKHRFQSIMNSDINTVDWQKAVNAEVKDGMSPKTVLNAWRLITASANFSDVSIPDVKLPKKTKAERSWLDYGSIMKFIDSVNGKECELAALILLHGLRRSELYDLTIDDIDFERKTIRVSGAAVYNSDGVLVHKESNKNATSQRTVPIVIPRLYHMLSEMKGHEGYIVDAKHDTYKQINYVCRNAGLPEVGNHGLRHSMISLAYHLKWLPATTMAIGGYSNMATVNDVYTHLAAADRNKDIKKMEKFYSQRK